MHRFTIIVDGWSDLSIGQLMNVAAISVGGLKSDGFEEKIYGKNQIPHSGIAFNMPILKAKKSGDFEKAIKNAQELELEFVVFSKEAQMMSNSFEEYKQKVQNGEDLSIVSMAIYGEDEAVRKAVKFLSVFS
jgi:Protein of unknown function (DUF2000)